MKTDYKKIINNELDVIYHSLEELYDAAYHAWRGYDGKDVNLDSDLYWFQEKISDINDLFIEANDYFYEHIDKPF